MAIVKIISEKDESIECIEEDLIKALTTKGDEELFEQRFDDNLMNLLSDQIDDSFKEMYVSLISEIIQILKNDY